MLHWHIFNWYHVFKVTPYWLCFCFRQKGGEHCLYCFDWQRKKGGRKIIYPSLTFYGFDCLPLCWWLTKRGRIICEFNMHYIKLNQISNREDVFNMHDLFMYSKFVMFNFNWYQDALHWHIFNWYHFWMSPLIDFVFLF